MYSCMHNIFKRALKMATMWLIEQMQEVVAWTLHNVDTAAPQQQFTKNVHELYEHCLHYFVVQYSTLAWYMLMPQLSTT